jgi:hypothetical protein
MTMKKSIENKWITATDTLKNELAGKASMPEVRRRMITRAANISGTFMAHISSKCLLSIKSCNFAQRNILQSRFIMNIQSEFGEYLEQTLIAEPEENNEVIEKSYDPQLIDIRPQTLALVNIIRRLREDAIDLYPDFQRSAVYRNIESKCDVFRQSNNRCGTILPSYSNKNR